MFFLGGSSLVLGLNLLQAASVPLRKLFFFAEHSRPYPYPNKMSTFCWDFIGIYWDREVAGQSRNEPKKNRRAYRKRKIPI